jgi:hypothetical protein
MKARTKVRRRLIELAVKAVAKLKRRTALARVKSE